MLRLVTVLSSVTFFTLVRMYARLCAGGHAVMLSTYRYKPICQAYSTTRVVTSYRKGAYAHASMRPASPFGDRATLRLVTRYGTVA